MRNSLFFLQIQCKRNNRSSVTRTSRKSAYPSLRQPMIFLLYVTTTTTSNFLYTALSLSLTNHNLSLHPSLQVPSLQVYGNAKLKKLCASKLESVGDVCIGNEQDQPLLDADLKSLATGSLLDFGSCYRVSNAPTVCGNGTDGVFSDDRCPSNACS